MPLNAAESNILLPIKARHPGGNFQNLFGQDIEKRYMPIPSILILFLAAVHSAAAQEDKAHVCVKAHTQQFEQCLQEAVERAVIDRFHWQTQPGNAPAGEDTSFAPGLNRKFMQDADKGFDKAK